ncbi:unnamed protein product [Lathyrus sativus]|nr:unnamed protein product [Lathyrus sativus]
MPYEGLDHQPDPNDVAVWTSRTPIIRFTTVEMHQSDRVKLQFGMHQNIPDAPVELGQWHQKRVDSQWSVSDWKEFAKELCKHRKRRRQHVLTDRIVHGARPSLQYMTWFRSVTTSQPFLSQPTYLVDPRQRASSSNTQQQSSAQNQPYHNPYMSPNAPHQPPYHDPYMQPTQSQPQPPYHYSPDTSFEPTPSAYSPDNSFDPTLSNYPSNYSPNNSFDPTLSNYPSNYPLFDYHTPQQPTHYFQPNSMYEFGKPYRPYTTQPPRQSFENMGIELNYGSAVDSGPPDYWGQMLQNLSDTSGPSQQNPPQQLNTQRPDTPQQPRRRPRRNAHPPQCGTGGRLDRADH